MGGMREGGKRGIYIYTYVCVYVCVCVCIAD